MRQHWFIKRMLINYIVCLKSGGNCKAFVENHIHLWNTVFNVKLEFHIQNRSACINTNITIFLNFNWITSSTFYQFDYIILEVNDSLVNDLDCGFAICFNFWKSFSDFAHLPISNCLHFNEKAKNIVTNVLRPMTKPCWW